MHLSELQLPHLENWDLPLQGCGEDEQKRLNRILYPLKTLLPSQGCHLNCPKATVMRVPRPLC